MPHGVTVLGVASITELDIKRPPAACANDTNKEKNECSCQTIMTPSLDNDTLCENMMRDFDFSDKTTGFFTDPFYTDGTRFGYKEGCSLHNPTYP